MKPPSFQGGKSKDTHEFFTMCNDMLEEVVGSPPTEWDTFLSSFMNYFSPLSMRKESQLRFLRRLDVDQSDTTSRRPFTRSQAKDLQALQGLWMKMEPLEGSNLEDLKIFNILSALPF
ncbi:hypothetical protein KY284_030214 [Solanum tuberosum]|nr:hypothetical protein KY284_030214 [Solanum tuberosum]